MKRFKSLSGLFALCSLLLSVLPSFYWWIVSRDYWAKAITRMSENNLTNCNQSFDPYFDPYFNVQCVISARTLYTFPFAVVNYLLHIPLQLKKRCYFVPPLEEYGLFLLNALVLAFFLALLLFLIVRFLATRFNQFRNILGFIEKRAVLFLFISCVGVILNFSLYSYTVHNYSIDISDTWLDANNSMQNVRRLFKDRNFDSHSVDPHLIRLNRITTHPACIFNAEQTNASVNSWSTFVGLNHMGRDLQKASFFFDDKDMLLAIVFSEMSYDGNKTQGMGFHE